MEEDGKVIWSKTGRGKKELVQSITWRNVYASASTMGWCQQQISTVYIQYCQIGKHSHTNSSIVTLCSVLSKIILQIEKSILSFFCDGGECRKTNRRSEPHPVEIFSLTSIQVATFKKQFCCQIRMRSEWFPRHIMLICRVFLFGISVGYFATDY